MASNRELTGCRRSEDNGRYRRQMEDLQEREKGLRSFFDSADMMRGIVELLDEDIMHIFVNSAGAALWGLTEADMRYRLATDLKISAESLRMWIDRYQESRRVGAPVSFDHVHASSKGDRYLSTTVTFLEIARSGRPRFAYMTCDVTERKLLEAQLLQARKMEAIGLLVSGIAHDFNNLLTVIIGYADLLQEKIKPDDRSHQDLRQIREAGARAVALTSQLLAFSRKPVFHLRNVDLNDMVAQTSAILRRLIGEDIDLLIVAQPGLGLVKVDPAQIQQVVMNIAVNARHAMPYGGKLTIETSNVEFDENQACKHTVMPPGAYVMVAISDNGRGMDAKTQAHIFEPFFATKRQGGTGLGLCTAYGIVKQSGGFIWVYSEPGEGTTFKIYLPRIWGEPDRVAIEENRNRVAQGSETVLVVEDEPSVLALIGRALHRLGYMVLEAANCREALCIAEEFAGTIHLLLADVVLPEMSGKTLSVKIRALRPGTKVLFISGYPDDAIVHHGVLEPNTPFLPKPFASDILALKVREALEAQ